MSRGVELPDYRNVQRGVDWLRRIINASERMDSGEKDAMKRILGEIEIGATERREREPGEDDV